MRYIVLAIVCLFKLTIAVTCVVGIFSIFNFEYCDIKNYMSNIDYYKLSSIGTIFSAIAMFLAVFVAFYFNNKQCSISLSQAQAMRLQLREMQQQLGQNHLSLEEVKKQTKILQEDLQISKRTESRMQQSYDSITKKDVEDIAISLQLLSSQIKLLTASLKNIKTE